LRALKPASIDCAKLYTKDDQGKRQFMVAWDEIKPECSRDGSEMPSLVDPVIDNVVLSPVQQKGAILDQKLDRGIASIAEKKYQLTGLLTDS
jgi:hypothetical protein